MSVDFNAKIGPGFTQDAKYGEYAQKHANTKESTYILEDKDRDGNKEYFSAENKYSRNTLFELFDKDDNGINEREKYYDENGKLEASVFNDNKTGLTKKLKLFKDGELEEVRKFTYNDDGQIERMFVEDGDGNHISTQKREYFDNGELSEVEEHYADHTKPAIIQKFFQ